ncbi:MAG TPA: hypothetical protein VHI71_06830 [Actinomycetota bacterium]|nr:hypothetical protein [Actinomycetota bacterium]
MWVLELFPEAIALALDALVTRFRAWRTYRRLYGPAERREHRRQLATQGPRSPGAGPVRL